MHRTGELGDEPPAAMAVRQEEGDQLLVLLRGPRPLLETDLLAARLPAHLSLTLYLSGDALTLTRVKPQDSRGEALIWRGGAPRGLIDTARSGKGRAHVAGSWGGASRTCEPVSD